MMTSTKILKDLRSFLKQTAKNPQPYRQNPQDFTRKRKFDFFKITLLMLSLLKSPYRAS